ncbi:MAG TPA: hypothetical protein VGJ78_05645 [Vicinamibacterales bacterium]
MKVSAGRAHFEVEDMETEDYHDLVNALLDGPSEEATASFEVEWRRKIQTQELIVGTVDRQFRGTFTQTNARVKWSARKKGFEFRSDSAGQVVRWAEVGEERNGVFFF